MTRFKTLLSDGIIFYSLLLGFVVVLMSTNPHFLSFVERAAEMKMNPLCLNQWLVALVWV